MRLSRYCQSEGGDRIRNTLPPPTFVLAPGTALRSLASVALSSGQVKCSINNLKDDMQTHKMKQKRSSRFLGESTNTVSSRFLCESTGRRAETGRTKKSMTQAERLRMLDPCTASGLRLSESDLAFLLLLNVFTPIMKKGDQYA